MGPYDVGSGRALPPGANGYADWAARTPSIRKLALPPAVLVYSTNLAPMVATARSFFIRTPSVNCRCLIRVGVEFEQSRNLLPLESTSTANGFNGGATLWMCHAAEFSGRGREPSPVANIIGSGSAPAPIPTDDRLWGIQAETKSAGALIYGVLSVNAQTPDSDCAWWLTVEFQGEDPMADQEWRDVIGGAGVTVPGGPAKAT